MADEYLVGVIEECLRDFTGTWNGTESYRFGWDDLDYEENVTELAEHIAKGLRMAKDPLRPPGTPLRTPESRVCRECSPGSGHNRPGYTRKEHWRASWEREEAPW